MKNHHINFCLTAILQMAVLTSFAQTFESLKLSSAPAYVILGVEPENITRPGSPTEFIGGIQNAIVNGKLTPNFAMEFTPYYWKNPVKDPQRFKVQDFFSTSGIVETVKKTFTISLATSASDSAVFGKLIPGTGVGAGIRFTICEGKPTKQSYENLRKWSDASSKAFILNVISQILIMSASPDDSKEAIKKIDVHNAVERKVVNDVLVKLSTLDLAKDFVATELTTARNEEALLLTTINNEKFPFAKQGFMLEAAAGEAILFQNNEWSKYAHARFAAWLTPSYRMDLSGTSKSISLLDAIGVLRYTFNNTKDSVDVSDYVDIGGKGKYSRKRWSLDFEFVYRYATQVDQELMERKYKYRATSSFEYRFNDQLSFKATYGTTFNGNTATYTDPKEIFVIGGLNIGIFNLRQ